MKHLQLIMTLIFLAPTAYAGPFTITCSGSDCTNAAVVELINQLETEYNNQLPEADASTYLKGMANASVTSAKGAGIDYANDIDLFLIQGSLGVGADMGSSGFGDFVGGDLDGNQLRGIGIHPTLTGGINMGIFDWGGYFEDKWGISLDKLKIFFNILPQLDYDTTTGSNIKIAAEISNFGLHFRYKFRDPKSIIPGRMLYWTGLDFSSGIQRTYMKISSTRTETITKTDSGATITASNATVTAGAEVSTWSIPVEVSTGVQWLYAFTTYIGAGADINFGEAKATSTVDAPTTISGGGITSATLTPALDLGQTDSPDTIKPRLFFGQQIGIPIAKLYVQMNYTPVGDKIYGLNAGVKLVW